MHQGQTTPAAATRKYGLAPRVHPAYTLLSEKAMNMLFLFATVSYASLSRSECLLPPLARDSVVSERSTFSHGSWLYQSSLLNYETHTFNSLPHLDEARLELPLLSDAIHGLGHVVKKHGLEDWLGVSLLHRHFDLLPGEAIVETVGAHNSSMQPEQVEDMLRHGMLSPLTAHALPYMGYVYKLGPAPYDSGTDSLSWLPLEFVSSHLMQPLRFLPVMYSSAFLRDARAVLERFHAIDKLGLSVYHRGHIGGKQNHRMEVTDQEARLQSVQEESLVNLNQACQEPIQVVFNFGSSQISMGDDWCGVCSH